MNKFIATIPLFAFFLAGCHYPNVAADAAVFSNVSAAKPALPSDNSKKDDQGYRGALDDIWIDDDTYQYEGVSINRYCEDGDAIADQVSECALEVSYHKRIVYSSGAPESRKYWLKYGFKDLLGKKNKQLIVFSYSGGAHCCYDYVIFDLTPKPKVIYDSSQFNSANEIGNELVPVDIDGDGTFEFYQKVMAFDYMGQGGHATATFPPAIFAFDKSKHKYVLATKEYPDFVLKLLGDPMEKLRQWDYENRKTSRSWSEDELREVAVREVFLFWVYAGKKDEAWEYFIRNYRTEEGDKYQDKFRDQFIEEFELLFKKDPSYLSIYGKQTR